MMQKYAQIFAVTIAFTAGAVATALVLAIPAVEQALGLSAWAQAGYESGFLYLLFAASSGLVVDLLRLVTSWLTNIGQDRDATSKT